MTGTHLVNSEAETHLEDPEAILAWLNETGTHLDKSKAKTHQGYTPAPAHPAVGGTSHLRLPPPDDGTAPR